MKEQVLSIEKMKHLRELDLDISSGHMLWGISNSEDSDWKTILEVNDEDSILKDIGVETIPAFTFYDIIKIMPRSIVIDDVLYRLSIEPSIVGYIHGDVLDSEDVHYAMSYAVANEDILDALYKLLVWTIVDGHISSSKVKNC